MCFSPQRRAIFRQQNVKKCSEDYSFLTFSLPIVLFTTAACNFATSELTKVRRTRHVLLHFHFRMCFSPQRRAILRHLNLQKCAEPVMFCAFSLPNVLFATAACNFSTSELHKKWSKHAVFCTFLLPNVLFATAACNFSTSELQKVVQTCGVLYIFTSKCAFRHSGVQFLLSLLNTYLRTRRFNSISRLF